MKKSRAQQNLAKRFGDPLRVELEIEQISADTCEYRQEKFFSALLGCASSLLGRPVDEFDFFHTNLEELIKRE